MKPDGTVEIVDHDALKKEAIAEAKEEKHELKEHHKEKMTGHEGALPHHAVTDSGAKPSTVISGGKAVANAMPDRIEAKQQEMAGVVV